MQPTLSDELAHLPAMDRLQLAQDLIESVTSEQQGFAPTAAHQQAAQERLAHYQANPDQTTVTLSQIRAALGLR